MADLVKRGPGRPRTREKHVAPVRAAEKKIVDRLPEIVDAQIGLALGIQVQQIDRDTGAEIVYSVPPDGKAGQYLMNRILGLPTAKVDVEASGGFAFYVDIGSDDSSTGTT
jgi:hypothetical protein